MSNSKLCRRSCHQCFEFSEPLTKSKRAVTENRREAEERAEEQRSRGAAEQRSRRGSRSLLLRESSRGGKEREEEEEEGRLVKRDKLGGCWVGCQRARVRATSLATV